MRERGVLPLNAAPRWSAAARARDALTGDGFAEAITEYLEEANNGASFVMVHTPEHDGRNRAVELLRGFGAHNMRYFGNNTITDLDAD